MNGLTLTQEMFEASKILAPAICRGRASLFFDGYGIRKSLKITGSSFAGKRPHIRVTTEVEFKKTVTEFDLLEYMELNWSDIKELLSVLGDEPVWITLNNGKKVEK
jgi:hypothetical protein